VSSCIAIAAAAGLSAAVEKRVQKKDLPTAVQSAIPQQTKGGEIKGYTTEVEDGKTFYEVETVLNGKTRDLLFDAAGALVEVEEETTLNGIPAAARTAIEKHAAGGRIKKVEMVTKGESVTYEAAIVRSGKTHEVAVKADGTSAN